MTLQQLQSLNDDELAILWFCINKAHPPVLRDVELPPSLFPSIQHKKLMNRIAMCRHLVKPENFEIFDGLINKLKVA